MQYRNPTPTVDVIIPSENHSILLIERKDEPFGWALPGGFVDEGETVESAAVREVKEELNLDIKLLMLLGVYSDPKRDPRQHNMSCVFVAEETSEIPTAGDDAKNCKYFKRTELPELCFDHSKIIEDYYRWVMTGKVKKLEGQLA